MSLELEGEANDYVAKGLSGGRVVVRPARGSSLTTALTPLIGRGFALVGFAFTLIGQPLPLVCLGLVLIGRALARSQGLTLG